MAAAVALAALSSLAVLAATRGPGPESGDLSPDGRSPFSFRVNDFLVWSVRDQPASRQARRAARAVASQLGELYYRAFLDPAGWGGEIPASLEAAFTPGAAPSTPRTKAPFSVRDPALPVRSLRVTRSALAIRVLLDASNVASAASARVRFQGTGTRGDGEAFLVRNEATYILRPVRGQWLIAAYPRLRTVVANAPAAAVTAAPTGEPAS